MLKKTSLLVLLGVALALLFGYGVSRLFILRFQQGDVYPPYSSLRSDPVGAKGLYEALEGLPGMTLKRNFKPLPKLPADSPVTLVYAGVGRYSMWEEREILAFDRLVLSGSRAIFGFLPFERSPLESEIKLDEAKARERKEKQLREERRKERNARKKDAAKKESGQPETEGNKAKKVKEKEKEKGRPHDDEDEASSRKSLTEFDDVARRWGLGFDFLPSSEERQFARRALLQDVESGLEPEIAWHSALYFKELKPEWKVLYRCEGQAVLIERAYGKGTIVLAADAYFFSNEAARKDRQPKLLAWFFDGPADVVFDEEHHGIREEPGIASLARKYRLHGVVAGLVLLAFLFVWKNALRFLPPLEAADGADDVVMGRESGAGFVNLLRRTIPPARILEDCVAEWRKTFAHQSVDVAKVEELSAQESARPRRERDPVSVYQNIARAISRHPSAKR